MRINKLDLEIRGLKVKTYVKRGSKLHLSFYLFLFFCFRIGFRSTKGIWLIRLMRRGMRAGQALFPLGIEPGILQVCPWKELLTTRVQTTWFARKSTNCSRGHFLQYVAFPYYKRSAMTYQNSNTLLVFPSTFNYIIQATFQS